MLKEVGASGQISLGKRFAGQLFDATFHPDGRVELAPVKVVPVAELDRRQAARAQRQARPAAESQALIAQWEADNAAALAALNEHHRTFGAMGSRLAQLRGAPRGPV